MARTLFTADGTPCDLVEVLGKGGEGSVFTLQGTRDLVAKVYHAPIDREKQTKLTYMVGAHDEKLLKYAAWPQATLHESRGGPVVGFTMQKVGGMKPIQSLYSPAQRKQEFPQRGWDFLVFAARNTAAAFSALHDRGFVAGDVNHGNLYVGQSAVVKLIDCDSYQLSDGLNQHFCEVGVGTYTPPELQGKSFRGVVRTPNHDNFGLGLLIWHLLMGGRHPFAGVPQKEGLGETIEDNIFNFRFAYSSSQSLLLPPPNALPLSTVPGPMAGMFEKAFTVAGQRAGRPTAHQWMVALDELRSTLRPCAKSKLHTFPSHLSTCPWCLMDGKGVTYFTATPIYAPGDANNASPVKIGEVWAAITKIPVLAPVPIPAASNPAPPPDPLPLGVFSTTAKHFMSLAMTGITIAIWSAMGGYPLIYLAIIATSWLFVGQFGTKAKTEEKQRRAFARDAARKRHQDAVKALQVDSGVDQITAKRELLNRLKLEFDTLAIKEQKDLAALRSKAEQRQRTAYLERFYIEKADLPGVGPAKRAALQSFGIETAAEINARKIMQIRGFGEHIIQVLLDWRESHERNFRFNPATAVTHADTQAVKHSVRKRAVEISALMVQGLKDIKLGPDVRDSALRRHIKTVQQAANELAQAEADCKALN
ncbi:MAG: helix-hairpin-helix domain-containing protein (plasmid) [Pseudomonas rhizophila]|uniref:helix-hairpin-helix domain-containing protein n=1 Tax=Pseudomonas rhizophila TaxID=2045200 RepID=UPI003F6B64AC